jgi:very-short-patch-repair endonuclease
MNYFRRLKDYNEAAITCCKCHDEEPCVVDGQSEHEIIQETVDNARRLGWRVALNDDRVVAAFCKSCWDNMRHNYPWDNDQEASCMNEIERKFADALCRECGVHFLAEMPSEQEHCLSLCEPQKPIGIYIVDFYMEDSTHNKYVVEIDGHESHKTKEQRYKDYCRERFLQKQFITVIRFTGSEVFVDADNCAKECLEIIDSYAQQTSDLELRSFEIGQRCAGKSA